MIEIFGSLVIFIGLKVGTELSAVLEHFKGRQLD